MALAYHGTSSAMNVKSIFSMGLDRSHRRRGHGAYLATSHEISMPYVGAQGALMLFVLASFHVRSLAVIHSGSPGREICVPEEIPLPVAQLSY